MKFASLAIIGAAAAPAVEGAVVWDGRFNDMSSAADLNTWSWSNQVGPYQWYIHGPGPVSSYVSLAPEYKNPNDTASAKGAKLTLDPTAFWNGQTMRRTELIPQTTAGIHQGKKFYHFSMMRREQNAPSPNKEHQICFFESHFTEMKYGWISGEQGTENKNLQFMVQQRSLWKTEWLPNVWHNVAYEIDFGANKVGFWHSTNANDLVQEVAPVSASTSSNGQDWHLGVLELPRGGYPDANEDFYFSGVYIEDGSITTSVSGPGAPHALTATTSLTVSVIRAALRDCSTFVNVQYQVAENPVKHVNPLAVYLHKSDNALPCHELAARVPESRPLCVWYWTPRATSCSNDGHAASEMGGLTSIEGGSRTSRWTVRHRPKPPVVTNLWQAPARLRYFPSRFFMRFSTSSTCARLPIFALSTGARWDSLVPCRNIATSSGTPPTHYGAFWLSEPGPGSPARLCKQASARRAANSVEILVAFSTSSPANVSVFCLSLNDVLLPLPPPQACRKFGLKRHHLADLHQMKAVPGMYSPNRKKILKSGTLVDHEHARLAGINLHGSLAAMEQYVSQKQARMLEACNARQTERDFSGRPVRARRRSPARDPFDGQSGNPHRFVAIARIPWLDRASRHVERGFYCVGCEKSSRKPCHWRILFAADTFEEHLANYGEIINGKHCTT